MKRLTSVSRLLFSVLLAGLVTVTLDGTVSAESPAEFYKGKTVTMWIAFDGGGFRNSARLVGTYLGKYIPGRPKVVFKQMPGDRGIKAATFMFNKAPRDGTAIGMVGQHALFYPIQSKKPLNYNPPEFNYIGTLNTHGDTFLFVSNTSGINNLKDLQTKELVVSNGRGGYVDFVAAINNILGTKVIYVGTYVDHKDAFLALERGETQGIGGAGVMSVARHRSWFPNLLSDKKARPILRYTYDTPIVGFPDVILAGQAADTALKRQALKIVFARQVVDRPFVAPPGVPSDRLKALQDAFMKTLKDPRLMLHAKSRNTRTDNPFTGPETKAFIQSIYALPQDAKDLVKKALNNQSFVRPVPYLKFTASFEEMVRRGRRRTLKFTDSKGKTIAAAFNRRRTIVTIGGKKLKGRRAVKALEAGMNCEVSWTGKGTYVAFMTCGP